MVTFCSCREWSPGGLEHNRRLGLPKPYCPKYEGDAANYHHKQIAMFYEQGEGRYPENVLELRHWKVCC